MDIKVVQTDNNQVQVFTRAGTQLVGDRAASIVFDAKGSLSAASQWNVDPSKRSVGTLLLDSGSGSKVDMIAGGMIGSGKIAALLDMRDKRAPGRAGADRPDRGGRCRARCRTAPAPVPRQHPDRSPASMSILGRCFPAIRSTSATRTPRPTPSAPSRWCGSTIRGCCRLQTAPRHTGDKVVGIDFSGGFASAIAQISSALGPAGLQVSNPSGTTLRVLDAGAGGRVALNALSTTTTMTSLVNGGPEVPLFLDGAKPYSGSIGVLGSQTTGFAGRIAVNPALFADPSRLVVMQTSPLTAAADPTRPNFILDRLTNGVLDFAPEAGIGTAAAPFSGSLQSYIRQMISQQGEAAANCRQPESGTAGRVNTLQQRFADQSNVNIDQEMANLLKLQTAYGANARVLSAAKDMLDQLFQVM
ncbi:MAG: flagellar basal body rod C-terminal domain-containing protein [Alphaproteobacteria bacterium]